MISTLKILPVLVVLSATSALAHDKCSVPMAEWQPRSEIAELARHKGWELHRIKIDDGCYEIRGSDADGNRVKAMIHPKNLEIMKLEIRAPKEKFEGRFKPKKNRDYDD